MARLAALFLLISATSFAQLVDRSQPQPQTPRQALVEILQSKDASSVERHLPEITKKKLREFSTDQTAGLAAVMGGHFPGPIGRGAGERMEVFDAGPILARFEEERTNENLEIVIESEDFRGDESHLELGFHMYKSGEEVTRWYAPRLLLHMKEEGGIWRVAEVAFTAKLPLSDPEFLDAMGKDLRKTRNKAAVGNLRAVLTAQIVYLQNYPGVGYACSLVSLGSGQGEASKREIGPLQASD